MIMNELGVETLVKHVVKRISWLKHNVKILITLLFYTPPRDNKKRCKTFGITDKLCATNPSMHILISQAVPSNYSQHNLRYRLMAVMPQKSMRNI